MTVVEFGSVTYTHVSTLDRSSAGTGATRGPGLPVTFSRRTPVEAAIIDETAQTDARIENLLTPDVPFGRLQLSQFVGLMINRYLGTTNPDGSSSARVVDDTAKNGEISSVTFTLQPDTTTRRGGVSIAVREKQGACSIVHDLRLGAINPGDRDYHHATIVRGFEPDPERICPITEDTLPTQLIVNAITELPETTALNDPRNDLRTTGRSFCARIKDWAAEVSQHEN